MGTGCCDLEGGTQLEGRGRSRGWVRLLALLSEANTKLCLHQKHWPRGWYRLELAGSGQQQPQRQQRLGLTQNTKYA